MNSWNHTLGMFTLRTLLGLIFLMQGFGKVFTWGIGQVYQNNFAAYENTFLSKFFLLAIAYYTSYAEMICGLLLVIGLYRKISLYILASVLLIVSFGHGLERPIWDLHHVFFRATLLIGYLLLPQSWDKWHLDRRRNKWHQNEICQEIKNNF